MEADQFRLHAELEERHWWFRGRRRILGELVRRIWPQQGGALIDIGCGTGGNIAAFARTYRCLGIDPSPEAIHLARARFPGVEFICGSPPLELGEAGGASRLFLLMDVLEHVPDDAAFLAGVWRMLRPGDQLLLTVPADRSLWSIHDASYGHYRRYDPAQLERAWAGLPVERRLLSYFNARLYPLVKIARALSRLRRRPWGRAGTDLKLPARPINYLLEGLFAGEARVLVELLEGKRSRGYRQGVSLLALLRRTETR